jgi:poly-gamma-glutamate synthesis protein (capsule biosynthesis protein)
MFGRKIMRGDKTRVDFTVNTRDEQAVLAVIRAARQQAEIVIVSVHSHEPSNDSGEPADFIRQFAHDAIDAGAQLIVGHGPHRLRGVEIYKNAPILYSLGNFIYQTDGLDFRGADQFDAGSNLYTAALGASAAAASPFGQLDRESWWQSALAVAAWENGGLADLKIYPLTLAGSSGRQGLPVLAPVPQAGAILRQISELSGRLGTQLTADPAAAILNVPIPRNR